MEDTFAIIKPDAFGKPWLEQLLEKNDEEDPEPQVDEDGVEIPPPPKAPWKTVTNVRAPDMALEIVKRIERAGFEIVQRKTMLLTPKVCAGSGWQPPVVLMPNFLNPAGRRGVLRGAQGQGLLPRPGQANDVRPVPGHGPAPRQRHQGVAKPDGGHQP